MGRVLSCYAMAVESYIKDTNNFLCKIETLTVPDDAILASFDIVSLYMLISHSSSIQAIRESLVDSEFSDQVKEFLLD